MLNTDTLSEYISNSIRTIVCPAIKQCILNSFPDKSDCGDAMAENFSITFDELVSEQLGEAIAQAIDYYIKNAELYGTIITSGSPATQIAKLNPMSVPLMNGSIPNTIGIK